MLPLLPPLCLQDPWGSPVILSLWGSGMNSEASLLVSHSPRDLLLACLHQPGLPLLSPPHADGEIEALDAEDKDLSGVREERGQDSKPGLCVRTLP